MQVVRNGNHKKWAIFAFFVFVFFLPFVVNGKIFHFRLTWDLWPNGHKLADDLANEFLRPMLSNRSAERRFKTRYVSKFSYIKFKSTKYMDHMLSVSFRNSIWMQRTEAI